MLTLELTPESSRFAALTIFFCNKIYFHLEHILLVFWQLVWMVWIYMLMFLLFFWSCIFLLCCKKPFVAKWFSKKKKNSTEILFCNVILYELSWFFFYLREYFYTYRIIYKYFFFGAKYRIKFNNKKGYNTIVQCMCECHMYIHCIQCRTYVKLSK